MVQVYLKLRGLTIKSIPKKDKNTVKDAFTSQHTWKITWVNNENTMKVANHCKSLASDVVGDNYNKLINIYNNYKK